MSERIQRITTKLTTLWSRQPELRLGQLLEQVENTAWDLIPQRFTSARLGELPDETLEAALDIHLRRTSAKPSSL